MYCFNCGAEINGEVNFCSNCGQDLRSRNSAKLGGTRSPAINYHEEIRWEFCEISGITENGADLVGYSINETALPWLYRYIPKPIPKTYYIANAIGSKGEYVAGQSEVSTKTKTPTRVFNDFIQKLASEGWEITGEKDIKTNNYKLRRRER
jgi:hypothetical protein